LRRRATLWQLDLGILGERPIQQDRVAEHLRDLAGGARRQRLGGVVAIDRRAVEQLELDQLVIGERAIDGVDERVGDAVLAEVRDRLERMAEATQVTTLLAGEGQKAPAAWKASSMMQPIAAAAGIVKIQA
jgi:hypothetical protein